MSVKLGPILQFRGNNSGKYDVSLLIAMELKDIDPVLAASISTGEICKSVKIAEIPFNKPHLALWRLDISIPQAAYSQTCSYTVAGINGTFHIPMFGESPRMAYASCNGFSDPKLMKQVNDKYGRWKHLAKLHACKPYHLLLLGGDQVYSDEMWQTVKALEKWTDLPRDKRAKAAWTKILAVEVDAFYANLYLKRWAQSEFLQMLQSIPTIMMWDDHDIMDGWGSYEKDLHECPIYQGIFEIATRYFHTFQMQLGSDERHPAAVPNQTAYSLAYRDIGAVSILVPDLRYERKPDPEQIISSKSWAAIFNWMENQIRPGHLIVMSSIPVAYLDLNVVERLLGALPGQQELEDDLRDHWRSICHLQERLRLIHRLFSHANEKKCRVTIVSGDVHVGAASVIESKRSATSTNANVINQLVSTGIVHPTPPGLVRYILESIGDKPEPIDRGITATMQPIAGKGRYLIGVRNWLALEPDNDNRLWVNWHLEGTEIPITKVIHPCES